MHLSDLTSHSNNMSVIIIREYDSPIGTLRLGDFHNRLCLCDWKYSKRHTRNCQRLLQATASLFLEGDSPLLNETIRQLDKYFSHDLLAFDLPLSPAGTDFQKKIWNSLMAIPYNKTTTYCAVARVIGRPLSNMAVANAIASNPISIIIPCHRVIGADGTLTGYAGGLNAKQALLNLEAGIKIHPLL